MIGFLQGYAKRMTIVLVRGPEGLLVEKNAFCRRIVAPHKQHSVGVRVTRDGPSCFVEAVAFVVRSWRMLLLQEKFRRSSLLVGPVFFPAIRNGA